MTTLDKNRLIGVAFLVVAFFHLATLLLTLFGFSFTYPYVAPTDTTFSKLAEKAGENSGPAPGGPGMSGMPGIPGISGMPGVKASPTPAPPETKAQIEAKRTMTMIYVLVGVQI